MNGIEIINEERKRQIEEEGFDATRDSMYQEHELPLAAACYALASGAKERGDDVSQPPDGLWPWDESWWKPTDPIRNLAKAGALIAAEIDRRLAMEPNDERATG